MLEQDVCTMKWTSKILPIFVKLLMRMECLIVPALRGVFGKNSILGVSCTPVFVRLILTLTYFMCVGPCIIVITEE